MTAEKKRKYLRNPLVSPTYMFLQDVFHFAHAFGGGVLFFGRMFFVCFGRLFVPSLFWGDQSYVNCTSEFNRPRQTDGRTD